KTSDFNTTEGATSTPGRMIFLEHSKLLQRVMGTPEPANGDSSNIDESSSDEDDPCSSNESNFTTVKDSDKMKKDIFKILSDSEPDENDVSKKEQNSQTKKHEAYVDVFIPGGVQEVAYTHSNQRIVGGSRAEELISRAAVRDVFELKIFSQMQANNLLGTREVGNGQSLQNNGNYYCLFVTFCHCLTCCLLCLVPRQQLEDMATKFQFSSVEQFATEVLKSTSNQRLSWLRQYYSLLDHADLANMITMHFPLPVSTKSSSFTSSTSAKVPCNETTKPITNTTSSPKKGSKRSNYHEAKLKVHAKKPKNEFENIPSPEADWPEEKVEIAVEFIKKRKKKDCSASNRTNFKEKVEIATEFIKKIMKKDSDTFISTTFSNNRDLQMSPNSPADSKIPRFQETMDKPTISPNSQDPKTNCESSASTNDKSFLIDLIGDTSILDDLFKPKKNLPKTGSSSKIPLKKTSKDLWDILQEGNEASLNRLTDPGEVQRVCITARQHYKQEESESLWKTNERFIWKK
uniref:Uncharacterized protein n=1 Tax=Periophthalmus magnuspinnatus TaxID=409849 RepID=A0A3B4AV85_9GOBI